MKIFLTEKIHDEGIKMLQEIGEVKIASSVDEDVLIAEGKDADAVLIRIAKITKNVLDNMPNLKVVAKHGIGTDNIDKEECTRRGIYVVNAPESNTNSVAEHTAALILGISKNLVFLDGITRGGKFGDRNKYPTLELKNKTVGFIGMGNIATLAAEKLSSFGVDIIAYDPYKDSINNGRLVTDIDEIYRNSDIISLHVPLTEGTRNLIGKEQIEMMKEDTIICSTARGGIIDEEALYEALKSNRIRGAALDVFQSEPPSSEDKLFTLDNVIASPHNAALSGQSLINMATHSAKGVIEVLGGNKPTWQVNKDLA